MPSSATSSCGRPTCGRGSRRRAGSSGRAGTVDKRAVSGPTFFVHGGTDVTTTVVVADDHPGMLTAVSELLEHRGYTVVGQAADGQQAVEVIASTKPQVAVVDARMPRLSGVEVAMRAATVSSETLIVIYTAHGDRALLSDALDAGVRGFVLKEAPLSDLVRAIERVVAGEAYIDPVVAGFLVSGDFAERLPVLTQRERQVLKLLADGLSNDEIGKRLHISSETVRTHVRKAMRKLEADTRTAAVASALRQSIIS